MAASTDQVRRALQQLAAALLVGVERIAERSVVRMQELLPAYSEVPAEELLPVTVTNTCNVLEAVLDPSRAEEHFRVSGETRVRQGISTDALLQAWRIELESVHKEAQTVADQLGIPDHVLLEFVEATLRWGDLGMRMSAQAHREAELRELKWLAAEQAALRRVATLVAQGVPSGELFSAVAGEVGTLLGVDYAGMIRYEPDPRFVTRMATWAAAGGQAPPPSPVHPITPGDLAGMVADTGSPARVDDWVNVSGLMAEFARELGARSSVASPIIVNGNLWGAMSVHSKRGPLPPDTQRRLSNFTELVATAIANVQAREEVRHLADEQAALRRVATFVAQDVPSSELFSAVAEEVGTLLGVDYAGVIRYGADPGFVTRLAAWAAAGERPPAPIRSPTTPGDANAIVAKTGKPLRVDDLADLPGPAADFVRRELGVKSSVVSPIVVNGNLWGCLSVHSKRGPLPSDTESRLLNFTELVATAIADAEARAEVQQLADEQAALRRIATLVAQDVPPGELLNAVATEVGTLLRADYAGVVRYEPDHAFVTRLAAWAAAGERPPTPLRNPIVQGDPNAIVADTGKTVRVDDLADVPGPAAAFLRGELGVNSSVVSPIVVNGSLWGCLSVHSKRGPLPPETESRLLNFTELVATAIADAEARSEVRQLADEQAALRRVATMVARESSAEDIFATVAADVARLLEFASGAIFRYEPGGHATVVGIWGELREEFPVSSRWPLDGDSVIARVYRTEQPARGDRRADRQASGSIVGVADVRSAVGTPVVVNGRLWGAIGAVTALGGRLPTDAESQIAQFAELVATAIANADSRAQLTASRARLVTEADDVRRRLVRDLHDGGQQRLVHAIVTLKHAQLALHANDDAKAESLLAAGLERAEQGYAELRELAHGILPAVLTHGGLRSGVNTIVSRLDLPVEVDIPAMRFPAEVEASAYFVVAEALTNVVKHSRAGAAEVRASVDDGLLHVEVRDDGVGGVDPRGHGLVGLADRVSAMGGRLGVQSPAGGGTLLSATLPLSIG
jgi:GAF domain-containing protein